MTIEKKKTTARKAPDSEPNSLIDSAPSEMTGEMMGDIFSDMDGANNAFNPAGDAVTPSWFAESHATATPEDLAGRYRAARAEDPALQPPAPEAYEAYRRRLEERFQSAKRMAQTPMLSPVPTLATMDHDEPPMRRTRGEEDDGNKRFREWQNKVKNRNARVTEKRMPGRLSPVRIAGLFVGACAVGGLAGFGSANVSSLETALTVSKAAVSAGVAQVAAIVPAWPDFGSNSAPPPARPAIVAATVLTKKPIKMARVAVNDVAGSLNNPIALDLEAFPAAEDVPLALKITGLPDDAYLTQGREVAAGEWLLKATEIDGVKLVVPQADSPQLDLAVAAVEEKSGNQATPPQEMTVELDLSSVLVLPANAPPEAQSANTPALPSAIPLPREIENTEAVELLAKAEGLMKSGDLVSARQFYVKAHALGLAQAALGAGQTYDPHYYATTNVMGLKPDRAKALEWYQKAADAGHLEALQAIETLNAAAQP